MASDQQATNPLNEKELGELKRLFSNDQALSTVIEVAGYLATYYQALITREIPEMLAKEMTIGLSAIIWSKILVR